MSDSQHCVGITLDSLNQFPAKLEPVFSTSFDEHTGNFVMRLLLKCVGLLWLISVLIIAMTYGIGRQQTFPQYLAALHLIECRAPCWIGITPGKTSVAVAQERIQNTFGNTLASGNGRGTDTVVSILNPQLKEGLTHYEWYNKFRDDAWDNGLTIMANGTVEDESRTTLTIDSIVIITVDDKTTLIALLVNGQAIVKSILFSFDERGMDTMDLGMLIGWPTYYQRSNIGGGSSPIHIGDWLIYDGARATMGFDSNCQLKLKSLRLHPFGKLVIPVSNPALWQETWFLQSAKESCARN